MRRRTLTPLAMATLFAVMAAAAACSSGGGDSALAESGDDAAARDAIETVDEGGFAAEPTPDAEAPAEGEGSLGSGGVVPAALQPADIGRDIVFRAELTVAVTDVAAAGREATAVIESMGGLLFGQETTGSPGPRSVLTFKVFPEDFQEALARLGDVGEIRSQSVTADDVTERIVDLESRINTAGASVERLRSLLDEATDIATIAQLENQLLERETQLETLRGQLRTLQNQVDLATIVLILTEAASAPAVDLVVTAYPGHDDAGTSCPGDFDLEIDKGDDATLCFEIVNAGDTPLTDFDLADPVLDLELADLIVVFGDPTATLEPGESIVLAAEIAPDRDTRTRTRVTATPVDKDGNPVPNRTVATTATFSVDTVDPGGLPGFRDGLAASWNVLVTIGGLLLVAAAAIVPFIWLVPLAIWLYVRWRRRRAAPNVEASEPPGPADATA